MADDGHARPDPPEDCAVVEEQLGVYVLGRLSAPERRAIARHLRGCPRCREAFDYIAVLPSYLDLLDD